MDTQTTADALRETLDSLKELMTLCRDNDVSRVSFRDINIEWDRQPEEAPIGFTSGPRADSTAIKRGMPDAEEYSDYNKVFGGQKPRFKSAPTPAPGVGE